MKKYALFALMFSTLGFVFLNRGCTSTHEEYPQGAHTRFQDLEKDFPKPPSEYGTIPFFVWNETITREGIDRMMQEFRDAGCGGVIVHPRPGLVTEYLSQEWFDLFKYTVQKGNELDLNVWIYDENSYPSGFAGGHVPALMPESYNQGQGLQPFDTTSLPADYGKYFLILKAENGQYRDITATAPDEFGRAGEYILFTKTFYRKSGWFGGFSYVDLLYPGVTEKFLEITIPGYIQAAGDEFGKRVRGVFTDEPEINTPGGIRWTPDLFEVFQQKWGYDLTEHLPSLWKETGDWKRVRHNYTQTLLYLFIERWSKPASEYIQSLGLSFTGHYWEHGWPAMRLGGDNMAMYAYHDVPGIDMLFNQFNESSPNAQFGNVRSVKELASVANQLGRHRTLSETYGGAGWEITFKDLKRLGDWQYALGVNLMNQHLSYYTIAGARKYDYPPSFTGHNPWWKSYKYLNDYYARLSLALSSGIQDNRILVIEPTTTAWLYDSYIPVGRKPEFAETGQSFQNFVTTLEKNQVEYDLGSEDIMRNHGKAGKKGLTVGKRTYELVVIPPMTESLDNSTFRLLKEYTLSGGKLLAFSSPSLIDGASDPEITDFFGQDIPNLVFASALDAETIKAHLGGDEIGFELSLPGNLYHHRRRMEDGQIVFLVNSSLGENTEGTLTIRGRDALLMDAFTGEIRNYESIREGGNLRLPFSLQPAGSLLLFVSSHTTKGYKANPEPQEMKELISKTELSVRNDHPNVLPLDFCDLVIEGQTHREMHVGDASNRVYTRAGFPAGNPWNHSVQYKTTILDHPLEDLNSGFSAIYRFHVGDTFDFSGIKAVVERPDLWKVSVNGHYTEAIRGEWWLDHAFGVYEAGQWIRQGENFITIECSPMHIHAEIEPVYLLGDFVVRPAEKGWKISGPPAELTTGSWKEQGLPFYSWDVTYTKDYEISPGDGVYEISLGKWQGTVAEVFVNGKKAGTIALPADKVDVTKLLKEGRNTVGVKVTGSLKNLLGPHHNNPAPGLTSPWTWRNIKTFTPGKEYQLMDYGLLDDFYLKTSAYQ